MTNEEWARLRKWLGWTQTRLAQELGFGRSTVTKYENGYEIPEFAAISLRNVVKLERQKRRKRSAA